MKAIGTYTVTKWDEQTYDPISSDMKMTKASVGFDFSGQMEGQASVEYLMFYKYFDANDPHKSSAQYVGLIRLAGKLDGKEGSFAMEDEGAFENGVAVSKLKIIPGSGRGSLKGISGTGKYSASQHGSAYEIHYELTG